METTTGKFVNALQFALAQAGLTKVEEAERVENVARKRQTTPATPAADIVVAQHSYNGALVANKAGFRTAASAQLVQSYTDTSFGGIWMHTHPNCSTEELEENLQKKVCPVDIGPADGPPIACHYAAAKAGSAPEWMAKQLSIAHLPEVQKLVQVANDMGAGRLPGSQFNVRDLLLHIYELDTESYLHARAFVHAMDVVKAFLRVNKPGFAPRDETDEEIELLAKKLGGGAPNPFTLGHYVRNLWNLGFSAEDIREKMGWWQDQLRRLEGAYTDANQRLKTVEEKKFSVGGGIWGIFLPDDYFLVRAVRKTGRYQMMIITQASGLVSIITSQIDKGQVARLSKRLIAEEPGCWKLNPHGNAVLNGGLQFTSATPTSLRDVDLRNLCQAFFRPERPEEHAHQHGKPRHQAGSAHFHRSKKQK